MEKTLEELKQEADALGVKYSPNIGYEKLAAKIEDFVPNEEDYDSTVDFATPKAEVKQAAVVEDPRMAAIRGIRQQEKENVKSIVVKISMVDRREASTATSAYFSTGRVAMSVPLDTWVEMPKILVRQAEESKALIHNEKDGVTISKLQKRYVIEYKQ